MNGAYCGCEKCEYNEDGICEHEDSIQLDENGVCITIRYSLEDSDKEYDAQDIADLILSQEKGA